MRFTIRKNFLYKGMGAVLFFLMLVAPFECYVEKITLMVFLVGYQVLRLLFKNEFEISLPVLTWFSVFVLFGVFFSLWAFIFPFNSPQFILKSMPVNIVWPIIYLFFIKYLVNPDNISLLNRIMVIAAIFISIYLILAALSFIGIIPISPSAFTLATPDIGRSESTEVQMSMAAITSLMFLNPFLLTNLLLGTYKRDGISLFFTSVAFLLTILGVLVSGRRTLILNILIIPFVIYLFLKLSKVTLGRAQKKYIYRLTFGLIIIILLLFAYLIYFNLVDFIGYWDFFVSGFDFDTNGRDLGSSIRGQQFHSMLQSWIDYPILGTGFGSASLYVIRSQETPWVYELSYMTLLFQTGIVGFIIYMSLLGWLFLKCILLVRKRPDFAFIIPSFMGCFCFLIGNASNPYLIAFDHMWAIFLPAGLINYCEIEMKKNKLNDQ